LNLEAGADRHNILARLNEEARRSSSKRDRPVSHSVSYDALLPLDLFCPREYESEISKFFFFFFFFLSLSLGYSSK